MFFKDDSPCSAGDAESRNYRTEEDEKRLNRAMYNFLMNNVKFEFDISRTRDSDGDFDIESNCKVLVLDPDTGKWERHWN